MHEVVDEWFLRSGLGYSALQQCISLVSLGIAIYVIVRGATAHQLILRPRRISGEPVVFKPKWYHRLLIVVAGLGGAIASLRSLLGLHWRR
jgi:hypothetical protein